MVIKPYDREKAVAYAHKWAFGRNPAYYDFNSIGGDCTNFTSQCIYSGALVMNYTPVYGWYYVSVSNRSAAWTGVEYIHTFMVNNNGPGPFAQSAGIGEIEPGDFVQFKLGKNIFQHSPFVVAVGARPAPENILVAAHTFDSDYRPLSSYPYTELRFVHILGVRHP